LDNRLHIVCWDIPYPANYGGAIDVFYKIKHFAQAGCKIILHCFAYGKRQEIPMQLSELCEQVNLYKRESYLKFLFAKDPYIVASRKHPQLLQNLCKDTYPIMFEGFHTCAWLHHPSLSSRKKFVRIHNIESDYYWHLSKQEKHFFKKLYYKQEFERLVNFEDSLSIVDGFIALSQKDKEYFNHKYPESKHLFCGPFHQNEIINQSFNYDTKQPYCLYHGNLQIPENNASALWLIENVFSKADMQCIIAGKNPTKALQESCLKNNVTLAANPSDKELQKLIVEAQINCLYTTQSTGLKLKLLNALYNGGHIICNDLMLAGSGVKKSVYQANDKQQWISTIKTLVTKTYNQANYQERKEEIELLYNNKSNAEILMAFLFDV
jgi:hypothetical protein